MIRILSSVLPMLIAVLTVTACAHYEPSHRWLTLIDGATGMENWNITGGANWRAEVSGTSTKSLRVARR